MKVIAYTTTFSSLNALEIIKDYDIVVDASDNVATRYLLNDACVLLKKVLVSGSALRMEGQVKGVTRKTSLMLLFRLQCIISKEGHVIDVYFRNHLHQKQ